MNIERMTRFLNDVQGIFMQYGWSYVLPRVSGTLDENDEPCDRLIDAHWKAEKFELLLSCDNDGFAFYGDNLIGTKVFRNREPSPMNVAEALHLLQS